ncbi:DEAD/DEAH box helicase family protein [Psychrobacter sp. T6-5]|uniref:DEAD/DEAH box helicase family protein n=1 Tax=Psychrobacter sp. T6-5 TaxID=3457451 RepID=UPI003FD2393A
MANPSKKKSKKINFHEQLVLTQWLWSKFNPDNIKGMHTLLDLPVHEGIEYEGEDAGQTKFFTELTRDLVGKQTLDIDTLRRYDRNIVRHWLQISEARNEQANSELNLKYFQYLSLLFTEYYLDQYFNHSEQMLEELNATVATYNEDKSDSEILQPYVANDLNKVAYWSATGSGKTLLMHINILQYQYYTEHASHNDKIEQIILLTPNDGLSNQHLEEFKMSGIEAMIFQKNKSRDQFLKYVQIIDIHKLAERDGDKTIAVESLEGQNLVLIDEGHRGTSSAGVWMSYRDTLTKDGFSFEYSATFGQAINKSNNVVKQEEEEIKTKAKMHFGTKALTKLDDTQLKALSLDELEKQKVRREALREVYAKNILFDYSYKYFYDDGYGKEVNILNMKKGETQDNQQLYLTACLLAFYQQQHLYQNNVGRLKQFKVENPLWVFVGNKVNDDDSDILTIIKFLADFLDSRYKAETINWIHDFITNKSRLVDNKGNNIFVNRFAPLHGRDAEVIYQDILSQFFNAGSNQRLNVIRITQNTGELRLQIGENTPFGVINVGDEKGLFDHCEKLGDSHYLNTRTDEFTPTLFDTINDDDSKTNLLIGSRKFTEGWSSWRVSTMGLLNMGSGEGSQIIQLFGRGVRLKGEGFSLKRTPHNIYSKAEYKDLYLDLLQTINIFGLHADYMEKFRDYLNDEGIVLNQDLVTLDFNTNRISAPHRLKTLTLKDGYKDNQPNGFKAQVKLSLFEIPGKYQGKIKKPFVILDLYPRLQAYHTDKRKRNNDLKDKRQEHEISPDIMPFFDFDSLYLQLQQYKMQRGYTNIRLGIDELRAFCCKPIKNTHDDWYRLLVDSEKLTKDVDGIRFQQSVLLELLQAYMDRFYKTMKNAYEGQYYEVTEFNVGDDDLPIHMCDKYVFTSKEGFNGEAEEYFKRLTKLQDIVNDGQLEKTVNWQDGSLRTVVFDKHLYYPLFSKNDDSLPFTWSPSVFDYDSKDESSEVKFVDDLQRYINSDKQIDALKDYHIYLLRNPDNRYKGLGFALAGNFYPDFLLWLVHQETGEQYLTLIDPKGIRNMNTDDAKINLYKEIKTLESRLEDKLILNSFILTTTPMKELINNSLSEDELKERNVLFMLGNQTQYLNDMFEGILS